MTFIGVGELGMKRHFEPCEKVPGRVGDLCLGVNQRSLWAENSK